MIKEINYLQEQSVTKIFNREPEESIKDIYDLVNNKYTKAQQNIKSLLFLELFDRRIQNA